MISFKEFLTEKVRTVSQASNLIDKIVARQKFDNKNMKIPETKHNIKDVEFLDYQKIKDVPVRDLVNTQSYVNTAAIKKKMHNKNLGIGEFDMDMPIDVHYNEQTKKYHIMDGHHRAYAHKLLGRKTIKAYVSK